MGQPNQIEAALQYLQQGDPKRALRAAKLATKQSPKSPLPPNVAGIALSTLGRPKDALPYFQKALKLNPNFTDARQNLAQALLSVGRPHTAKSVLQAGSLMSGDVWKHHYLLAQAYLGLGQENEALTEIDFGIANAPKRVALLHLRSKIQQSLGRIGEAIGTLKKALEIDPSDVHALTALSLPLARHARSQEALDTVETAVNIDPKNIVARFRLATQLVEMGRMSDAQAMYQTLLEINPHHAPTLERLAELLPTQEAAALEEPIRTALTKVPRHSEDRASLLYALSIVQAAADNRKDAHKALQAANREMARLSRYDATADEKVTNAILRRFAKTKKLPTAKQTEPYPIFIIGLPRSGTTLAEAILGMHPNVTPLGERGTLGFLLRETIEQDQPFTAQDAAKMMQEDKQLLPPLPDQASAYTDKMPENYRLVGFLDMVHPDAKIVHIRRDPRDNALSMWKSHFSSSVLSYTYDLEWMAQKFNLYTETLSHWHDIFPGRILDIQYEDMVADVESVGKKMAAFCGLDWHPEMTRPDKSTEQVLTLSATQLRRPVHTKSVGKWRKESDLLQPFINALAPSAQLRLTGSA